MKKAMKLLSSLPTLTGYRWDKEAKDLVEVPVTPAEYAFIRVDEDVLRVSGENGFAFVDYYGEFRDGYPWIAPELEEWAEKHGGFWEWENPSNVAFYYI